MGIPTNYEEYTETLTSLGESIIQWSDPEGKFGGYTEVRPIVRKPAMRTNGMTDLRLRDGP